MPNYCSIIFIYDFIQLIDFHNLPKCFNTVIIMINLNSYRGKNKTALWDISQSLIKVKVELHYK
jgi:RNAse (barnase) inhibitor barstar